MTRSTRLTCGTRLTCLTRPTCLTRLTRPTRHDLLYLHPRQRPAQIRHRPAALEDLGVILVDVVQEKLALAESADESAHRIAVERSADGGRRAFEAVEDARLVAIRLQASDHPRPGVRQRLVVEVHRVLRRQHHADTERARLLQQREHRRFRRRVRYGRQVAGDLVHVDDRAQARRACLLAHPAEDLIQQQRDEEHPLGVAEMRDGHHRDTRLSGRGVEQALDVERLALHPRAEPRRGQQVVERHRELEPLGRREERLEIHDADLLHGRCLDQLNQRGDVEVTSLPPRGIHDCGEQDVFAALDRVGVDAQQSQQARRGRGDPFAHQVGVAEEVSWRRGERLEDRQLQARVGSWRVDGEFRRILQACDAAAVLVPFRQAGLPQVRLRRGPVVRRLAVPPRLVFVYPGPEVRRGEVRERQEEVAEVALRIDHDRRNAIDRGLLQQVDADARLAAAGHADAHGMRDEIRRVVQQVSRLGGLRGRVDRAPKIEESELLVVWHSEPRDMRLDHIASLTTRGPYVSRSTARPREHWTQHGSTAAP